MTLESPQNDDFSYGSFNNFFNWTMTYRLDRLEINQAFTQKHARQFKAKNGVTCT